ncbi:MAG: IS1634 family transposase [Actinomycetota bacterium]|nr:IS1634 family transposase [Actinomycetota bacterium]
MADEDRFTLNSESIGAVPIVNWFLDRMGVFERLERFVPHDDARLRLAPAAVIGVVLRNIIVRHRPVYAIAEWAQPFDPSVLGLSAGDAEALNDDRVGRMLDRLFDADRATLITETVLAAVRAFEVDLSQLHNDSTTVTVTGSDYPGGGEQRGGQVVVKPTRGHNKDFRPDLLQLLFVLTVSADAAVPIAYRVYDGNTADDVTHIPTWDELRALVGNPDFLYVADAKLCSKEAMGHIASNGGRFVTLIPRGRKEDTWFRDWAQTHAPPWSEAERRTSARIGDPDEVWRVFEAPLPSTDGYRVVWVHSSVKAARDAAARSARVEAGLAAIEAVQARLASPKSRLKTLVAAEAAASEALADAGAGRWVGFTVTESTNTTYRQERRGRPGANTRYRRSDKPVFSVTAHVLAELVSYDAATDGCFPLVTCDPDMTPAAVLAAYRYQPNLERRHHMLKGPQLVAPVFLESPHRIEALLLCHFLAMLAEALIEREIRNSMKAESLAGVPLYPEFRNCPSPSAPRILEIFSDIQRHHLMSGDDLVQVFEPQLTPMQQKVLDLLHVPANVYTSAATA